MNGHVPYIPNRPERRRNDRASKIDTAGLVDFGKLAAQREMEDKMARSRVVVFPVSVLIEWMRMDGSYTVVAEGFKSGEIAVIGIQPVADHEGNPCVSLVLYNPEWPVRMADESPIMAVTWKRFNVEGLGDEMKTSV